MQNVSKFYLNTHTIDPKSEKNALKNLKKNSSSVYESRRISCITSKIVKESS